MDQEESDDPVTDEDLMNASSKLLSTNWQQAGRELGLTDALLDRVKYDNYLEGLEEIKYQMLSTWKQQFDKAATKRKLKICLEKFDNIKNDEKPEELTDEEFNDTLIKVQADMENTYLYLELPKVTWFFEKMLPLEEYFVDLVMVGKDTYGEEIFVDVKLERLFDETENKSPKRILIEGHPGYGKTTLICKLASDWAHGIAYIREKFDLIFVILLRDFDGDLENSLLEQCDIEGLSPSVKKRIIAQTGEKALLLMDGYDELNEANKTKLMPLLQKKVYPSMTVIVTSRTEEMHLQEMKQSPLAKIGAKTKDFSFLSLWNKRIQIKGISGENRKDFLQKYFKSDPERIYQKLSHLVSDKISNLYECPLFLLLLAVLIEEEEIKEISTRTELYKKVFNFIVNRYLDKSGILEGQQNIDIFDLTQESLLFNPRVLLKFGELILEKLQMDILSFTKEEILKNCENDQKILNLGFLHKNTTLKRKKLEFSYEPLHKTFLEFLASFYVFSLMHLPLGNPSRINFDDKIISLFKNGFLLNSTSLFCPFLVGLLGKDAFCFMHLVSQYQGLFHETFLLDIYSEMEKTKENNEKILAFIPSTWRIFYFEGRREGKIYKFDNWKWFYYSDNHRSLISLALENKVIHQLIWELSCTAKIPFRFHVPILELEFHKEMDDIIPFITETEISCEELRCEGGVDLTSWEKFKLILNYINFKVISFKTKFLEDSSVITQFEKEVMEGLWENINIKVLEGNQIIPEMIKLSETLLKSNFVKSLFGDCRRVMKGDDTFSMISFSAQAVVDAAFQSEALKRLYFTKFSDFRRNIKIDLSHVTSLKKNGWELIHVDRKFLWKNYEGCNDVLLTEGIAFAQEREHQLFADVKVLSLCSGLKAISLPTDIFYEFAKSASSDWPGFNTITEIHLYIISWTCVSSFILLSRFRNLLTLAIDSSDYNIDPNYVDNLLVSIGKFALDVLFFGETNDKYLFVNSFLKRIMEDTVTSENVASEVKEKRWNFICKNLRIDFGLMYSTYDSIEETIRLCFRLLLNKMVTSIDFFHYDLPGKPFKLYFFDLIDSPEKFQFSDKFSSANSDFIIHEFEKQVDNISVSLVDV